ncbi:MAG: hypothetical protein E7189_02710 [Erysipelotrichaceae bacterium]|nr:hypothetical protein [Lachnospiraceae bacterium]MBE6119338.1 hypothetical protein [Erysipelotrichaceae bacterium]
MNNIGIDVSEAQGNIDFDLLTAEYMIIRVGIGSDIVSQDDKQFARNVAECTKRGIPYGLYLYSYALNMDECLSEVQHFLRLYSSISDKSMLKLGCWYDMEDADNYKENHFGSHWSNYGEKWCRFCNRWVDEVKKATGEQTVGVYASLSPLKGHLSGVRADIPKWVACWINESPDTSSPLFPNAYYWQYTSKGKMDGIYSEGLDMDISYIDIPSVRPAQQPTPALNTIFNVGDVVDFNAIYVSSTSEEALTPAVTSGTITKIIPGVHNPYLINDGTGWVNDACIISGISGKAGINNVAAVVPGANIRIANGAIDLNNGKTYAEFVYNKVYVVMEISENRVVFGDGVKITGATDINNCILA